METKGQRCFQEKIRGKGEELSTPFWPVKLPKMSPRASETDIEVFLLFGILCLSQRVITTQLVVYFSHIICHFEGDRKSVV